MTLDRSTQADRVLLGLFDDLADARTPDYLEAAIEHASSRRQRPAWTFPERWLPMADITSRPAFAPRLPWRTIAVALLILALAIGVAVAYVGTHQTRLANPFGIAANGLLVYERSGDIYTLDPTSGRSAVAVTGAQTDTGPGVSPDGSRLAFQRDADGPSGSATDIVVSRVDGSDPIVVTARPILGGLAVVEWAPDSRSLIATAADLSAIWRYEATPGASPRVLATDADAYLQPFRPPDGSAVLIRRHDAQGPVLIRLDLDTMRETILAHGTRDDDLGAARWSPDGSTVLYNSTPQGDPQSQRLFLVEADGSGTPRQITSAPGVWYDIDASWSPDGKRIAFTRYEDDPPNGFQVRPIGIYSLADGSVISAGPLPRDARAQDPTPDDGQATQGEGFEFEWSPDGRSLIAIPAEATTHPVLIDALDGTWRNLDPIVEPGWSKQAWQRLAP